MADGLSESPQVVQDDVGLWTKFILIRSVEMPAIEHRKIGVGVEDREDQAPLRMEHAVQLTNRDQWRVDERERQIADDAVEGVVLEGKALRPIRLHPIGGQGGVDGEGACKIAVEFPMQGTKTLSGLRQRVLRMPQPDHVNGTLRTPSTLSRAVGLVDHGGPEEIAVADSHIHEDGARFERAE